MSLTDLHNYRLRRSPSPTMYRSSLRDRYDETPWNVRTSDRITDRVVNAIRRNQSMDHLDHYASPSYYVSGWDCGSQIGQGGVKSLPHPYWVKYAMVQQ